MISEEYPLGGMVEPYDIDREAQLTMNETTEPIKTYNLYLKSHCEAPDFEVWVEANSIRDAVKELRRQYGEQLYGTDDKTLADSLTIDTR